MSGQAKDYYAPTGLKIIKTPKPRAALRSALGYLRPPRWGSRQIAPSLSKNRLQPGSIAITRTQKTRPQTWKSNPGPLALNGVPIQPFRSPKGAAYDSPGQRPGLGATPKKSPVGAK